MAAEGEQPLGQRAPLPIQPCLAQPADPEEQSLHNHQALDHPRTAHPPQHEERTQVVAEQDRAVRLPQGSQFRLDRGQPGLTPAHCREHPAPHRALARADTRGDFLVRPLPVDVGPDRPVADLGRVTAVR